MEKKYTYAELQKTDGSFFVVLSETLKPNEKDYRSSVIDTAAHLTGDFIKDVGNWVKRAEIFTIANDHIYDFEMLAAGTLGSGKLGDITLSEALKIGVPINVNRITLQYNCQERKLHCQDCGCPQLAVLTAPKKETNEDSERQLLFALTEAAAWETQMTTEEKLKTTHHQARSQVVQRIFNNYKSLILK